MRAFLSHSSKDKALIERVASFLRPGSYELDSETFDLGLLNSEAIIDALRRSTLFCLFLSEESTTSSYVNFETLLGTELLAGGLISRLLVICLDEEAFRDASPQVKFFNILRRATEPESIARLIQGQLVASSSTAELQQHPFVGREDAMISLEQQANDPDRPAPKAVFISGNFGAGRRTLAKKFYQHQYPSVGRMMPTVLVDEFAGFEELHRHVLSALRPSMPLKELGSRASAFAIASQTEQARQIAELINAALAARESVMMIDQGGLLKDDGAFQNELDAVLDHLSDRPHPPLVMIAPRMVPFKHRRSKGDVAHIALQSLERGYAQRLAAKLLKDKSIQPSSGEMQSIITLADGHPFNFYRLLSEIEERGLEVFLADPSDFIDWKHRQSSE